MIDDKASLVDRIHYALCWVTAAEIELSLEFLDMSQEEIADFSYARHLRWGLRYRISRGKGWALKPTSPSASEH